MSALHDAEIISYIVDFKSRTIMLFTEYWHGDCCEKSTVTFKNVVAHSFQDVGEMSNIIFDIDCFDVSQFLTDYAALLEDRKNYGWPLINYSDKADLLDKLKQRNQHYYAISSSCGLTGFILAEALDMKEKNDEN